MFGHCSGAEDGLTPDQVAAISAPRLQRYFETKGSHLAERTWREWNTLANSFQPLALEFLEKVSTVIKYVSADSIATPCRSRFWFVDIQVYNTHRCIPFWRGCLQKMVSITIDKRTWGKLEDFQLLCLTNLDLFFEK